MKLDELQRLAAAATPGPWAVDQDDRPGMQWNRMIVQENHCNIGICSMFHSDGKDPARDEATAAHIAAFSPDLALKLIAIARAAKDHIESLDAYDKTLVPINRSRGTAAALRKSLEGVKL